MISFKIKILKSHISCNALNSTAWYVTLLMHIHTMPVTELFFFQVASGTLSFVFPFLFLSNAIKRVIISVVFYHMIHPLYTYIDLFHFFIFLIRHKFHNTFTSILRYFVSDIIRRRIMTLRKV